MRAVFLVLTSAIILAAQSHQTFAVDLKNCNQIAETRARMECLHSNTVLLNSSYQTVARELRSDVVRLKAEVAALTAEVDKLKKIGTPDLSNVVRYGDPIQLHSGVWGEYCLDHDTGNARHIQGHTCNDVNKTWRIRR